jgi:UDP:flavonoid glycosyltransferase YjiC (YdhE family)
MAHIVFITSGIASIRNANFELARRLAAAGHRITYMSPDPIRDAVEAQGLPFIQLHQQAILPRTSPAPGILAKLRNWFAAWFQLEARLQHAVAALGTVAFVEQARALAPDLFLIDVELHEYVIAAAASTVPVALLSTWIALDKRPRVPPLHRPIIPGQGWAGSAFGIEWSWVQYRVWKWFRLRLDWLRTAGVSPSAVLQRHAEQAGFRFRAEVVFDQWLLPFSYRRLPVLCLNAYELDLPHQPLPHYCYVGPMVHHERRETPALQVSDATTQELDVLLAQRATLDPPRPLIYCAFGAFFKGNDIDFVRRVVQAVAERPQWDVVVGLGGRLDISQLGPLPAHVRVYGWVPQLRVLAHADCAVIHTGISTINECIEHGVPMLAYPFKKTTDQMGNAARITYHHLGIVADRDTDDPERIRSRIERMLGDNTYRSAVRRMRDHFRRYADQQRAEACVQELLRSPTKHLEEQPA